MAKQEIKTPYFEKKDPRFSDGEILSLSHLKEETIKLLRKVFYQDELNEEELAKLKLGLSTEAVGTLRKIFTPDLDWTEPLFSMPNRWNMPRFEGMLTAEVRPIVQGRQKSIAFFKEGLARLQDIAEGGKGEARKKVIDLKMENDYSAVSLEETKKEAVAMQETISHLESSLLVILSYADKDSETIKDVMKRLQKDSAK